MSALWVSPLRDIQGFLLRYCLAAAVIVVLAVAASLIADRIGNYALASLLPHDGPAHLCNAPLIARLLFALLATMELVTMAALLLVAVDRRRLLPKGAAAFNVPVLGAGRVVAVAALALFLHLGLYAIAFRADNICAATSIAAWLKHYTALISFAALYVAGSLILIGAVLLAAKPALLAK
jgi:hypothetical protein